MTLELATKETGSLPERSIDKIFPICNTQGVEDTLLVQTKEKRLSVLKLGGNKISEVTSKEIEDFEKAVGAITNTDVTGLSPEDALVLVKVSKGIEFHKIDSTGQLTSLNQVDDQFEDASDWKNQLIIGGKFHSNPKTVSVVTLRDHDVVKVFTLDGSDLEAGLRRQWSLIPHTSPLYNATQIWVTRSGYTAPGEQSDWITGKKNETINSFRLVNDPKEGKDMLEQVLTIKLPDDLKDSVKNVQFLPKSDGATGKFQDMVVFFNEDVAMTYGHEEGKDEFQIRSYFYGSNSFISSSCDGKRVFAVSDGPTIKAFKGQALSEMPLRWSGDLMRSTFVWNGQNENDVWVVGNSGESDELVWYNTEIKEVPDNPYIKPNRTLGPGQDFPEVSRSEVNALKYNLRVDRSILDILPSKAFTEAVSMQSGAMAFDIQLIPEIGFGIQYTSSQVGYGGGPPTMGKDGWSTRSANYIAMDPKSDTFESEVTYYLILDSSVYSLEFKDTSGTGSNLYKVINSKMTEKEIDSIKVSHDPNASVWTVDTKTSKLTFGDKETAIKWAWSTRTWEESAEKSKVKVASEWHLTRFVKKQQDPDLKTNLVLLYDYDQVLGWSEEEDESKRKQFTETVQLVKVQSEDSKEVLIKFEYDGNRRLKSYDAQVEFSKQNVHFVYNNGAVLTEIQQTIHDDLQTMIKFSYGDSGKVSKVEIPERELEVDYNHQLHSFSGIEGDIVAKMTDAPANTMATAAHSSSLSVFATTNRLFTYSAADGKTEELGHLKPITEDLKQLRVTIYQNSVIRHSKVSHGDYIDVFSFDATAKTVEWKLSKAEYLAGDVKVQVTQDGNLITLDEKGNLKIAKWSFEDSAFKTTNELSISISGGRPKNFQAQDHLIAWYNEDSKTISWVTKKLSGWSDATSYVISARKHDNCATFFNKNFDLGSKGEEAFENLFENMMFQVRDNALTVCTCSIDDYWQIKTHIDLLILDNKGNQRFNKRFDINQENLRTLRKSENDLDFKYVKEGDKFLLEVTNPEYPEHTAEVTKQFREENAKHDFRFKIFDHEQYIGYFTTKTIFQLGNSIQVRKEDEASWLVDTEYNPNGKYDVKLGKGFKLAKTEVEEPIDLVDAHNSKTLYSFSSNSKEVFPLYPGFIASLNGNNTEVVSFRRDAYGREITGWNRFSEEVVQAGLCSPEFLVTSLPENPNEFTIRLSAWMSTNVHEMYTVDSVKIKGNQLEKSVAYEYQKPRMTQSRQLNFGEASLIRGGDKSKFGYITYSFDISSKYPKVYDGKGAFVEELRPEQKGPNPEREDSPTMLLDKWKMRAITDLSPFKAEDCQVGYIGFEDYEETSGGGGSCSWNFSKSSVVRSGMSLTGNNFLRLGTPQESLKIEFPLRKDQSYSISTWVRSKNRDKNLDKVSKILQATIQGVTLPSKVVFTRGDWQYLEIKINSYELKSLWKNVLEKNLADEDRKVQLEIRGEASDGQVDVDNVLFAHSSWNSEIFVYNEKGDVTSNLLGNSGLLVQNLYDPIEGDAIAKTNGLGQVNRMQFETFEKGKNLKSLVQFESIVEPGWVQGFLHDPFATFKDEEAVSVFQNGFRYNNSSKENELSIDIGENKSLAWRFSYSFLDDKESAIKVKLSNREYILKSRSKATLSSVTFSNEFKLQSSGSIVFALIDSRLLIWNSEGLLWEDGGVEVLTTGKLYLSLLGNLVLEDMVIIPNPSVRITYSDTEMQELQVVNLVDDKTAKVFENNYDVVGRVQAKIKDTYVTAASNENLMTFKPDFVTSVDIKNQKLEGDASTLNPEDKGVPFVSVVYDQGPMDDWIAEGRPGPQYSISGTFGNKYSRDPNERLEILFPPKMGYKFKSKSNSDGYIEVVISDKDDTIVANAALTPGAKHLLATYDYDAEGRLVASLSPQYHEVHNTLGSLTKSWKEIGYSKDDPFGTFYDYSEKGHMIKKVNPDVGVFEYVFDEDTGNPSYTFHKTSSQAKSYDSVIYYEYQDDLLSEVGELTDFDSKLRKEDFIKGPVKGTKNPIKIIENLGRRDALTQAQRITTKQVGSENMDVIQELDYSLPQGRLSADIHVIPSKVDEPATELPTRFKMSLDGDKVLMTGYSLDDVALGYSYNLGGLLSKVDYVKGNLKPVTIARYEYAPNGQVSKETLLDINTGNQQLITPLETTVQFNSPGYPVRFSNPFFTQEISYDCNGYGDVSTGEPGYPSSTSFDNIWSQHVARLTLEDLTKHGLSKKDSEVCYNAVQRLGYLDDYGKIVKLFRTNMDVEGLPIHCSDSTSQSIATAFSEIFMARMKFSYKFQYGNHKELIKVKFVDSKNEMGTHCSDPLTVQSLQKSLGIDEDTSGKLWQGLSDGRFLIEDKEKGKTHATQGKSNIDLWNRDIIVDLKSMPQNLTMPERFGRTISHALGTRVGSNFSEEEFSKIFEVWGTGMEKVGPTAAQVYKLLQDKTYLSQTVVQEKILKNEFTQIMKNLTLDAKKVFSVLTSFFACEIGKSPQDMEVFEMDFNGNPKVFYTGFERSELTYQPNSNKILSKKLALNKEQKINHDAFGNLNAIYDEKEKPLLLIDYDKISSRPVKMELGDGRKIYFRYDYKGERVSKQVYGTSGKLEQEVKYLGRDAQGRVLIEQELTYVSETLPPRKKTTSFFYGPRGLFAFLRNGKYFNVLLDNIGSTRLVLRNGQVAASYTYLPYGKLASKYIGPDPDGDIRYRFTGQEFDEETGLYNFHFRIYDPAIGRFYQVDPLEEFFSPYKYAGNAPIVFTDPDGRFIFTLIAVITLAVVGAYLGAAAVNGTWNPLEWKWNDYRTWIGLGLGALAGGLMPSGIGASFAFLAPVLGTYGAVGTIVGLGTVTAYFSMASASSDWDPTKWDWTSPALYSAAFEGFATGAGFFGGIKDIHKTFIGFTKKITKVAYVAGGVTLGIGFAYFQASSANDFEFRFWKWDFTKPGTFNALIVSGTTGAMEVDKVASFKKIYKAVVKQTKAGFNSLDTAIMKAIGRAGSYNVVASSKTPLSKIATNLLKLVDYADFAVANQLSSTLLMYSKDDWDKITQSQGLESTMRLMHQGMQSDFAVNNFLYSNGTASNTFSVLNEVRENQWMEHVADGVLGQLHKSSAGFKSISPGAFLMNNGEMLAITGLSDFSFDGAVILLEKKTHPELFNFIESQRSEIASGSPASQSISSDKIQQVSEGTKLEHLVSLPHDKQPLRRGSEKNQYCETFGKISSFDKDVDSPFFDMVSRGSNYIIPQENCVTRPILTHSDWKKQSDDDTTCHFKEGLPKPFSSSSDGSRVRRSVTNSSTAEDFPKVNGARVFRSNDDSVHPSASSSSSRPMGFINYGAKLVSKLWNRIVHSAQKPFRGDEYKSGNSNQDTGNFYGRKQNGKQDTNAWRKCVPWVHSEDGYVDGFTCFSSSGIVQVTPKLEGNVEQGAIMTTDSQDTYGNCNFYKGRGIGSAYCEGHKSNMRYISFMDERPFDRVNDNLLLVGLLLHFYQTCKSDAEEGEDESCKVAIESDKIQEWKRELQSLNLGLQQLRSRTRDEFYHIWALNLLEDRMTDLEEFEKEGKAAPEVVQEFEDNLAALRGEILEGFFLSGF